MKHYKIEVVNTTESVEQVVADLTTSKGMEMDFPNEFPQKLSALKKDLSGEFGFIREEITYKDNGVIVRTFYATRLETKSSLNIIEVK